MKEFIGLILMLDPALTALVVMFTTIFCIVFSWHRNTKIDFHLQQCLTDSVTGKIAIEKIGYMTVLAMWCWGFVALYLKGQLNEWYVGGGLTIFVLGRTASQGLSVVKDIKTGAPQ